MHSTTLVGSVGRLDLLLVVGIAVFCGTIGARVFQKLRIPQVVGYIVVGIVTGGSVLNLINLELIRSLVPFNLFALGIIGFMIGGELKYEIFKQYGKQFITILLTEGLFAFFIVTVCTTLAARLLHCNWHNSLALGLVLGAISSATAPAATVDVLWEYKTRGILTRTILAIVALDDGLALLLYGFASTVSGALLGRGQDSLLSSIVVPLWEICGAAGVGISVGLTLVFILKYIKAQDKILAFSIASILLVMGLSAVLKVESILAAMIFGATLVNLRPRRSQSIFKLVESFSPPVYVLFFVLVGARLQVSGIQKWILILAVIYVLGRSVGKISGSWFGAAISNSPGTIRKYLGICLFSQAGVAIGLSILASERFGGDIGEAIIVIITATTFLVQIIGPPLVKLGVKKAGEVGLNVTEDELIASYNVRDVMDTKAPVLYAGTALGELISLVGSTENFYYPVVDNDNNLIGAVTIAGIRKTFTNEELNDWLVALDIMEPVAAKIPPDTALSDAFEQAKRLDTEYLPVVASIEDNRLVGILDCRAVRRSLSAEALARQQKADSLMSGQYV
ncbi:MAG TPA: cation:proton antiporter [Sedimentisphaerales bacterium]|nr:cation:proton antiporter [Sedimentisphaerales bacterium]